MSWEVREGDCLDPATGLASLADRSVDHVICDPPYEVEAHTKQQAALRGTSALPFAAIGEPERGAVAREFARLARRWVVVFCQAEAVTAWRGALCEAGLRYLRAAIWVKPDGMPQITGDRPAQGYESIVIAHATERSRWNGGGRAGVWTASREHERTGHPTTKPLALMEALVRDFTDPGELICDPFAGSGTTLVACKRLGRNAIGWERDPTYAATARRRVESTSEQTQLFAPKGPRVKQTPLALDK